MTKGMPQELEVWYILPAVRKELAKFLIKDFKLKQKEAASLLGLTEAAVSQYVKEKRASGVVFDKKILNEIKKSAGVIFKDNNKVMNEIMKLCNLVEVKKILCVLHKKHDKNIEEKCKICFG
jgi:hypothetical protein